MAHIIHSIDRRRLPCRLIVDRNDAGMRVLLARPEGGMPTQITSSDLSDHIAGLRSLLAQHEDLLARMMGLSYLERCAAADIMPEL